MSTFIIREGDPRYSLVQDLIEGDSERRDRAEAGLLRCPSCEHAGCFHDSEGRCWFTATSGLPGANLVCPCKVEHEEAP